MRRGRLAGTPSLLSRRDPRRGSSVKDYPASAVLFDLKLPNGTVFASRGTSSTSPRGCSGARCPPTGDDRRPRRRRQARFGEDLPDANVFKAAADAFVLHAGKLDRSARVWRPTASMRSRRSSTVPTMSEYFGQWKTSRFVLGDRASSEAFKSSRGSAIGDIIGGLRVIYAASSLRSRGSTPRRPQMGAASSPRSTATSRSCARRSARRRFTPQQADVLGREAQERDGDRRPGLAGRGTPQGQDRPVGRCGAGTIALVVVGALALAPSALGAPEPWSPPRNPPRRSPTPRPSSSSTAQAASALRRRRVRLARHRPRRAPAGAAQARTELARADSALRGAATTARSPRLAQACGRRSCALRTSRRRPPPPAATSRPRAAGSSCASSGRRRGSPRAADGRWRSTGSRSGRSVSAAATAGADGPAGHLRRPAATARSTSCTRRPSRASTRAGRRPPRRRPGDWRIVRPTYVAQRGPPRRRGQTPSWQGSCVT